MTPPESKKPHRGAGSLRVTPTSTSTSKSPIATPPRVALRSKHENSTSNDNASTKSSKSTGGGTPNSDDEDESSSKDAKIAELQNEIQTMENEFERELAQLSYKLTNESETSQFWQQKHSSLNQTFLKTDTDLRLLRSDLQGREERDRDIKNRISGLMVERDQYREAYNEAMGEVREKDEVIRGLRGQVRGLKSWVSSSSKSGEQVTDEVFGEGMVRLGNGLQNWVIVHFRRVKIGRLFVSSWV
jgi:chromosome segregation ATPase